MNRNIDKNIIEQLFCSDLFKGIQREKFILILKLLNGEIIEIPSQTIFYNEGDIICKIGVVLSGEIQMVKKTYNNCNNNIIYKYHRGNSFGVDIAYTRSQISPYIFKVTIPTKIFIFHAKIIDELPSDLCYIIHKGLISKFASDNIKKQNKIEILCSHNIRKKILMYLYIQCNKHKNNAFKIRFTRKEMANYLNVNRTVLSHELSLLKNEGIIEFKKNYFKILK